MSLYGLGIKPWTCIYGGRRGDCDNCNVSGCTIGVKTIKFGKIPDDCFEHNCMRCPRVFDGSCSFWMGDDAELTPNTWHPLPPPSVECPQRCASCWQAPDCVGLKKQIEFVKDYIKDYEDCMNDYWEICRQENRSLKNFHDCLNCKRILNCIILKRSMASG